MKAISTLTEAKQHAKTGWIAALLVAGITLALSIAGMAGTKVLSFGAWTLLDVVLSLGLAYGMARYSRVCAVIMLVYYAASQIITIVQLQRAPNLLGIVLIACFWQGIRGTFAYHRLNRQSNTPAEALDKNAT